MYRARSPILVIVAFTAVAPFQFAAAQDRNWKQQLDAQLKESIQVTSVGTDRFRITKPGSLFTIQRDGISADLATDKTSLISHVSHDGSVRQPKGIMANLGSKKTNRDWAIGDPVYVTGFGVDDDHVDVRFISEKTLAISRNGSTEQTRYQTILRFDFPKDSLRTMDAAAVLARVEQVLQPVASTATAAGAQPKTVELGQTTAQVEAAFGKPEKIIKLGAKVVYVYKDVKVTFTDGKVTDVQ